MGSSTYRASGSSNRSAVTSMAGTLSNRPRTTSTFSWDIALLREPRGFEGFLPGAVDIEGADFAVAEPDEMPDGPFDVDLAAFAASPCASPNQYPVVEVYDLLDLVT